MSSRPFFSYAPPLWHHPLQRPGWLSSSWCSSLWTHTGEKKERNLSYYQKNKQKKTIHKLLHPEDFTSVWYKALPSDHTKGRLKNWQRSLFLFFCPENQLELIDYEFSSPHIEHRPFLTRYSAINIGCLLKKKAEGFSLSEQTGAMLLP